LRLRSREGVGEEKRTDREKCRKKGSIDLITSCMTEESIYDRLQHIREVMKTSSGGFRKDSESDEDVSYL
jgi:hypothetical protein